MGALYGAQTILNILVLYQICFHSILWSRLKMYGQIWAVDERLILLNVADSTRLFVVGRLDTSATRSS